MINHPKQLAWKHICCQRRGETKGVRGSSRFCRRAASDQLDCVQSEWLGRTTLRHWGQWDSMMWALVSTDGGHRMGKAFDILISFNIHASYWLFWYELTKWNSFHYNCNYENNVNYSCQNYYYFFFTNWSWDSINNTLQYIFQCRRWGHLLKWVYCI